MVTVHSNFRRWVIPLALSLVSLLSGWGANFAFFEPVQPPRPFQVIVHRGESHQAPENSRPALQRCIEDGLEWAEVDVRLTQDGQHILSHNASVTDASGKEWKLNEHTLAELRQLDVGSGFAARFSGEHLLSLEEAFSLCKDRLNLYLDCKDVHPGHLADEILESGMRRQVVVYVTLDQARHISDGTDGKVATMTKWRPDCGGPEWAVTNGLAAVEIDAPELTPAIREAFGRAGIKVQAKVLDRWDRPEMWDQVVSAGADWLQTDLPEELLAHALWRRWPKRPVEISLHRGANRYAPENTLPAFAKAVRLGVDYVEFDVRATRDGAFFLLHDSRLNRTTDGTGPIDQTTADAVRQLSAGVKFGRPFAEIKLPSMDEFLGTFAGQIGFYFDAKAIPPAALEEALQRYKLVDRTVVYQSPSFLAQLKAINPQIRGLAPLRKPGDLAELASNLKPYGVDAEWDILSPDLIARCHAAGIRVFSDALGDHERIEDYLQAMTWGIDVIQTDHPLRVMRAVELRMAGTTPATTPAPPAAAVKP